MLVEKLTNREFWEFTVGVVVKTVPTPWTWPGGGIIV